MADSFDLVVIGAGPGGYVAAIRAAQLGMSVACVEKRASLGGTCLNIGCIPSKALLHSSEKFHDAKHSFAEHGIKVTGLELDLPAMMARKDKVVDTLTKGIAFLFKKNKIEWVAGTATIPAAGQVKVTDAKGGARTLTAKRILIATGSESMPLPGVEVDEKRIVTSTGALSLDKVPGHLVVIGAGYIGLEMGSVWARLGAKVTVVEYLDRITPGMDGEIAKQFQRVLQKQGFTFRLGAKVSSAKASVKGVAVTVEPAAGGAAETFEADVVLLSIGRRPNTDGLGLDKLGVALDKRGFIQTDGEFQTNVPGIYAIGDVRPGPMLAHKAEDEGVVAAERMAGVKGHIDYDLIPGVVYTWPEVASVGKTEEQLKDAKAEYKVGKFPFMANSRAKATGETDGLVKILADAKTDRVLGVHIMGPDAGTVIHECTLAMEFGGAAEDIARSCHAHPTYNEAVKEAALAVDGRAIHI
ncbi:MAG: dihydrolipoyl dehydrogenase [Alphaproteobacteria bacterium]